MKKLYRKRNSQIAGICSGISDYVNIDKTIIRVIFIILFFTTFPIVWVYLIMWLLIPKEDSVDFLS